jgi:hypothetical protein
VLPLLLPVEITSRELDAKILLGLFAAERGYDVIVGRNQPLKSPLRRDRSSCAKACAGSNP